ncbi:glutathione-dependent formaldehyde-activating [Sarocladium implicatum]|nr:glutathione-dependent formaldehyde-activating [Sarocladium implicatum]
MTHYASKPGLFPMQGGCPCGLVRFQLELPPLIVHCCHCTACQRQQGSAFAINAVIEPFNITPLPPLSQPCIASGNPSSPSIPTAASPAVAALFNASVSPNLKQQAEDQGEETPKKPVEPYFTTYPSASTIGQHIARCPGCHAALWNYYAGAGQHEAYVAVGTLDRACEVDPDAHIYTRTRRSFVTISDGKPQFESFYPDRSLYFRPDSKDRVEALKLKVGEWREARNRAMGK